MSVNARAVQNLVLGGKARALLYGRSHVTTDDVKALAYPVLRHRILTNFTAASEGVTTDTVVKKILDETPDKDLLTESLKVENGFLLIPDGPGIGVELIPDAREKFPPRPRQIEKRMIKVRIHGVLIVQMTMGWPNALRTALKTPS